MSSQPYRFCPACGTEMSATKEQDGGVGCPSCGKRWYRNPAPTAGCVLVKDGRALITQRGIDPEKGRFDVPGGFLAVGESPAEGVKRELREELGVEVEVSESDYVQGAPHRYGRDGDWTLALGFKARLVSGDPTPADDVAAFRWVGAEELDQIDFAWEHDRELVRKVLADGDSA
jgi:NADH pyrophosphatase NudC (nudix superfamily)